MRASPAADGGGGVGARGIFVLLVGIVVGLLLLGVVDSPAPGTTDVAAPGDEAPAGDEPSGDAGEDDPEATTTTSTTMRAPRAPREVKVLVANASGVDKAGARFKDALTPAGYNLLSPATAKDRVDSSVVQFAVDYQADAAAIARALELPPTAIQPLPPSPAVRDLKGANVLVLVGPDLANRPATPPAAAPSSTTARAGATTSTTAR